MGETSEHHTPASVEGLKLEDLHRRLGAIGRRLSDQELTEDDQDTIAAIDWIDYRDTNLVEDDPRVIEAQRALSKHRHDSSELEFMERCKLTEWQVLLDLMLRQVRADEVA